MTYKLWSRHSNNDLNIEKSTSCSFQEAQCLSWSSVCVRILKKQTLMPIRKGLDSKARVDKQSKCFLLPCPLYRLQEKAMAQMGSRSTYLKRSGLNACLSISKTQIRSGLSL